VSGPARGKSARVAIAGAATALPATGAAVLRSPFGRKARLRCGRMLDALLTGRGWIALVFVLLAGIVFFNVDLLQLNREIAVNTDKAADFKRENAQLRLQLARLGSTERIQEAAAELGFVWPAPGDVEYLKGGPGLAERAARRISAPQEVVLAPTLPEEPLIEEPVAAPIDPAATDPAATDPAVTDPAATDPALTDPAATDPAATAPPPAAGTTGGPAAPPTG
jgi:cell division protein FtsL